MVRIALLLVLDLLLVRVVSSLEEEGASAIGGAEAAGVGAMSAVGAEVTRAHGAPLQPGVFLGVAAAHTDACLDRNFRALPLFQYIPRV